MNVIRVGVNVVHWPQGGLIGAEQGRYTVRWQDGSATDETDRTIVVVIPGRVSDTP